jgi:hypothetical protein
MSTVADPRTTALGYLGPRTDPEEIRNLRASSLDFHTTLGQLVIHKHRWNEMDVRKGLAQKCPLHDDILDQQDAYDNLCFGTGYLGGFSDGILVPVTFSDTQEDVFRPNSAGVLIHERHPGLTAPWYPELGDGDILIVGEFAANNFDITELGDRYILREVRPTTMRGPGYANTLHMKPYRVGQESMIDLLPYNHQFYNVPVNFDYNRVFIPAEFEMVGRLVAAEADASSSRVQDGRLNTTPGASRTQDGFLVAAPAGTHVHL